MSRMILCVIGGALLWSPARADPPSFKAELVFPLHPQHNHAPGIVEFPHGDLFVSWYRGSGERSADDVAVYGARLRKGATQWPAVDPQATAQSRTGSCFMQPGRAE